MFLRQPRQDPRNLRSSVFALSVYTIITALVVKCLAKVSDDYHCIGGHVYVTWKP